MCYALRCNHKYMQMVEERSWNSIFGTRDIDMLIDGENKVDLWLNE